MARCLTVTSIFALAFACAAPGLSPPTPQEILGKPAKSDLKDAHFTLTGHFTSGATGVDVKGEGLMVIKPKSALRMTLTGSLGVFPFSIEQISVEGQDYQRVGNQKWTKTQAANKPSGANAWSEAKGAKLVAEEDQGQGKAWHVTATSSDGKPIEIWVRESDGYPLKMVTGDPDNNFTLSFDRFNTGQTVTGPPASEIKPDPKNVTGTVGQPMHLTGVDVTVVSVDPNAKGGNQYLQPKPGNRFVATQILYENTGSDPYDFNPFDWNLTDSAGFSYNTTYADIGPELHSGKLAAGEKARGYITYEVPTSATGLTLKLKSGEDTGRIPIG